MINDLLVQDFRNIFNSSNIFYFCWFPNFLYLNFFRFCFWLSWIWKTSFLFNDTTVFNGHDRANIGCRPTVCLYGYYDGTGRFNGKIIFFSTDDAWKSSWISFLCCSFCIYHFCCRYRY